MLCPYCKTGDSRVVDTRKVGKSVRRRRECLTCDQRFTTYEQVIAVSLMVVKRDGRREPFNRQKLRAGIQKACAKRPVSAETVEELVGVVENDLYALARSEVESDTIGEMVMSQLRPLDDVAYVRFASVYRRFKDIDGLMEEIKDFRRWKKRSGATGS
jgi:transcriptional repressor NrdR